jgi:two-component system chemotaxis response regulator CheB
VSAAPLDVLVVDDSAVARQVVSALLTREPGVQVRTAPDPLVALDRLRARRPDVVLLDLEMPRMDGLTFLRRVMEGDPLPVVVFSGFTPRGADKALEALRLGAVEVLGKPAGGPATFQASARELLRALREAAGARPRAGSSRLAGESSGVIARLAMPASGSSVGAGGGGAMDVGRVVAVGASTGGPEALHALLGAMPADCPPILVAQHMPAAFTPAFAARLHAESAIDVREAADGDEVRPGLALLAPGDAHMRLRREGRRLVVRLARSGRINGVQPSVDELFHSVAGAVGEDGVGVLLTGMGADGAEGLLAMRSRGARTIAQDEASSVVWGMPGAAVALGAAADVLPLERIAAAVLRACRRPVPTVRAPRR